MVAGRSFFPAFERERRLDVNKMNFIFGPASFLHHEK